MKKFKQEIRDKDRVVYVLNTIAERINMYEEKDFKPIEITIQEVSNSVTRRQHNYLFGVVYEYLKQAYLDAGYEEYLAMDVETFHTRMKTKFYYELVAFPEFGGIHIPVAKSLKLGKAVKSDVVEYITRLIIEGANLGVEIPSPEAGLFKVEE